MSSQEEVLLRAVLNNPDDDAPRLAFASLMDQRGDRRGEFIRIQIRMARLRTSPNDPAYLDLADESNDMIDLYGASLAGPIAGLVEKYTFGRGFVQLVELLARAFLNLAPRLFALAPIKHLNLLDARGVTDQIFASPFLERIRSLALRQCQLGDADIKLLAASPHLRGLRWLSLQDNEIGKAGARALAASTNLPNLKYVEFDGNPFNPNMRFGFDQGMVADFWMPDEADELESEFGRIEWLRCDPVTMFDVPPSRFE